MKKVLRHLIQDLQDGQNIENYLLIVAAIVVAVLSLFTTIEHEIVSSVTLAVLALLVYREIEGERLLKEIQRSKTLRGISAFYEDRNGLPAIEDRIRNCKREIAILGFQLGGMVHNHLQLLEEQASAGCLIKLLMMSPVTRNGEPLPWIDAVGEIHTFSGLQNMLSVNIAHLNQWLNQLSDPNAKSRIEVRVYDTPPTASTMLIDKDTYWGSIKVEPLIFKIHPANRPSFSLQRADSPELYDRLVESFNAQWENGIGISEIPTL